MDNGEDVFAVESETSERLASEIRDPGKRIELPSKLGLAVVLRHDGPMPMVPRSSLRLLDTRQSTEVDDPQSIDQIRRISRRYHKPVEVRHDILYHGSGLDLFRGTVFQGDVAVEGTFHRNLRDTILDSLPRLHHFRKRQTSLIRGRYAFIQKPGSHNYFHWMLECLPRFALLEPLVAAGKLDGVVLLYDKTPDFVLASINMYFPSMADRVVIVPGPHVMIEDLHFFISGGSAAGQESATRMSTATKLFIDSLPRTAKPESHIAFVPRGTLGNRKLINEADLVEFLSRFYEIDLIIGHELTLAEQQQRFATPKAIVGVHGAGLTNLIYAPTGCKLIEITALQYFNRTASFHDSNLLAGGTPYLVLGDQVGDKRVVEKNIGNDILVPAESFPAIRDLIG